MRRAVLVAVLLLLQVMAVVSAARVSAQAQFHAWKAKHNKRYASAHDEAHAWVNFQASLVRIAKLNRASALEQSKDAKNSVVYGLNSLSDLSPEEFRARYLSGFTRTAAVAAAVAAASSVVEEEERAVPESFDWRQYSPKSITAIKNQGNCGACYAFAAVEALEAQHYLTNHEQLLLSTQQSVDCDPRDGGCEAGDPMTALDYMIQAGVELNVDYPYVSGSSGYPGVCAYNKSDVKVHVLSYQNAVPSCNDSCPNQVQYEDAMKAVVAAAANTSENVPAQQQQQHHGPPVVCIDADNWQDYKSGVYPPTQCRSSSFYLSHCAQLVGYTPQYWIVRNSWGTLWGMQGYIYLQAGNNTCGLLDYSFLPQVVPVKQAGVI